MTLRSLPAARTRESVGASAAKGPNGSPTRSGASGAPSPTASASSPSSSVSTRSTPGISENGPPGGASAAIDRRHWNGASVVDAPRSAAISRVTPRPFAQGCST